MEDTRRDVDEEDSGRGPREEAQDHESAADDFRRSHERPQDLRRGDADFREPSRAELGRVEKFLDSLRQKDTAHEEADEENSARRRVTEDEAAHATGSLFGVNCQRS